MALVVEPDVMVAKQVLTHDAQLQPFRKTPGELRVEPGIRGYKMCRQAPDKITIRVPRKIAGKFKMRTQLRLVSWVGTLRVRHARCVQAAGFRMQMHFQKRISGAECPS